MTEALSEAVYKRTVRHVYREGSRDHVVYWDSNGAHCSRKDCEINSRAQERVSHD